MVNIWAEEQQRPLWIKGRYVWLLAFLVSFLFSACAKTTPSQKTLKDLHVRTQERLFLSAKSEFEATHYSTAIQKLSRFISTFPRSTFNSEVIWMLARSYHESGNIEEARRYYQRVLSEAKAKTYHQDTQNHLAHLRSLSSFASQHQAEVLAIQMSWKQWLQGGTWNTVRLKNMANRGVTTQLINLGCGLKREEVYMLFDPPQIKMSAKSPLPDFLSFVKRAHREGIAVFIGVNLRCLGWLHAGSNKPWADRAYDYSTKTIRATRYFDVFNPDYQDFLKKMLTQISYTGVDGIVFLSDAPMGMSEGLTPVALDKFRQAFGVSLSPQQVFSEKGVSNGRQDAMPRDLARKVLPPKNSKFWRWVGWRARTRLMILRDLLQFVKKKRPQIQIALEVFSDGLTDPLRTLVHYAEDILESRHGDFSFLLVDLNAPHRLNSQSEHASLEGVAKRLLDLTEDPTKIWLTVPNRMEVKAWSSDSLKALTRTSNIPQGMGLVYDLRPFS